MTNEDKTEMFIRANIERTAAILSKKVDDGELTEAEAVQLLRDWCQRSMTKQ